MTDLRQHLQKVSFSLTDLKHDGLTNTIIKHRTRTIMQTKKALCLHIKCWHRHFCHFIKASIRVSLLQAFRLTTLFWFKMKGYLGQEEVKAILHKCLRWDPLRQTGYGKEECMTRHHSAVDTQITYPFGSRRSLTFSLYISM